MLADITPGPDGIRVWLDPPVMVEIADCKITLFDGGDAGRVLWRKPDEKTLARAREAITRALQTPGR